MRWWKYPVSGLIGFGMRPQTGWSAVIVVFVLTLAGCGGGSSGGNRDDPPPVEGEEPTPVALSAAFSTSENASLTDRLPAKIPDGVKPGFSIVRNGTKGSAVIDDPATGAFTFTPSSAGEDSFTFRVNGSNVAEVSVTIIANRPPTLAPIEDQTVVGGDTLSFTIVATDPDGPWPLALEATGLPAGATFVDQGDGTGTFNWLPDDAAAGDSPYAVTFRVTDAAGFSDSRLALVTVLPSNYPPVWDPVGDRSVLVGESLSFSVTATDPDGPPPVLTASALPAGALFTDNGGGTGSFSWEPAFEDIAGSPFTIEFTATDADDPTLQVSVEARVNVRFADEFTAESGEWLFVNEVPFSTSESWAVIDGALQQQGKVEGFDQSYHLGTYAYLSTAGNLTDYRFTVDAVYLVPWQANDIGVMFRYQDSDNYYRLSMNARYGFTRLEKKVNGEFAPLAVNGRGYRIGVPLRFTVEVRGDLITVWIDEEPVFAIEDDSLQFGTIALYTQHISLFERLSIEGPSQEPWVVLGSPIAYTVTASDTIAASAPAPLAPSDGKVAFLLNGVTAAVDDALPFAATLSSLIPGDYTVEAVLQDADGIELARDTNPRVGVGGRYFLAIGDSITNGAGDRYALDNRSLNGRVLAVQGYQAVLVDLLEHTLEQPVMVYNAGIGGDKSFHAAFQRVESLLDRHPGSTEALIILGTNDSRSEPSGLGCTGSACNGTFKGNMQALIDTLNAAGKDVYVANTPPTFGSGAPANDPFSSERNQNIQKFNAVIDNELTGKKRGPDLFSFFLTPSVNRFSLFSDALHPNALGHSAIAYLWHNALNPARPVALPFLLENLTPSTVAPFLKQNLLEVGNTFYVDRGYRLTAIPAVLQDGVWIMTADSAVNNNAASYLSFEVDRHVMVYVAYDAGATILPGWMGGFTDTGLSVSTDHPQAPAFRVYRRTYDAGSISLGGNLAGGAVGAAAHYLVFVKPI